MVKANVGEISSHNFGARRRYYNGGHYRLDYWKVEEDVYTCPKPFPTGFIAPEDTSNSSEEHQSSSDDMSFLQ
jgi:hypothetical protein